MSLNISSAKKVVSLGKPSLIRLNHSILSSKEIPLKAALEYVEPLSIQLWSLNQMIVPMLSLTSLTTPYSRSKMVELGWKVSTMI